MVSVGGVLSRLVKPMVLAGLAVGLFMVQPAKMRGLSRTWEGVKAFWPGLWPHPGYSYDAPWQGLPSCNRGRDKWWIWHCSHRSNWGGLRALDHHWKCHNVDFFFENFIYVMFFILYRLNDNYMSVIICFKQIKQKRYVYMQIWKFLWIHIYIFGTNLFL